MRINNSPEAKTTPESELGGSILALGTLGVIGGLALQLVAPGVGEVVAVTGGGAMAVGGAVLGIDRVSR